MIHVLAAPARKTKSAAEEGKALHFYGLAAMAYAVISLPIRILYFWILMKGRKCV